MCHLLKNNFKKKTAIILLSFFLFQIREVKGQPLNIVPNYSFELIDTCPLLLGSIGIAQPWFGAQCGYNPNPPYNYMCISASTDIHHLCTGVPPNFDNFPELGYQMPRTGSCMAGAGIVFISNNQGREYLEVTLLEKLKMKKNYCGSFYLNSADKPATQVSGIGMALTKDTLLQVSTPDCLFCMIDTNASIQSPIAKVITDSVGWTCIKGIYTAQGDEMMMTVGSFLPWDSMEYIALNPPPFDYGYAYYFFDDFSVVELPDFSLTQSKDSICAGDSVLLSATTSALWNGLQYRWFTKNNNQVKDSLSLSIYVKPLETTTYYFQFFDTINEVPCLVDYVDSVTIFVKPSYNLVLSPTDTIICAGKSILIGVEQFEDLHYQWEPSVYLSNAESSKTIATPSNTITYTLSTLTDSNNKQCLGINTASVHIEVMACEPTEEPIMPNVLLYGNNLQIKNLHSNTSLKIYNELGQIIYENKNYQNNWQALVSAGIYLIKLNYKDSTNQDLTLSLKLLVLK
jgi:hypothetical protein